MQVRVAKTTTMTAMVTFNLIAAMKKLMKSLMLFAAAAMALTSCENEAINEGIEKNDTFTVNFVTDAPESRTSVEISEGAANFAWGATGEEKFQFIQNKTGETAVTLGTNVSFTNVAGKGEISATFKGDAATEYNFTAIYPAKAWVDGTDIEDSNYTKAKVYVNDAQTLVAGSFDPNSDLLVSRVITGTPSEVSTVGQQLQFTRLVSIAEMNLKLLQVSEGEKITGVKFSVNKGYLAGRSYVNLATGEVVEYGYYGKTGTINLSNNDGIEANEESVKVYFTCFPTTIEAGTTYTITVTTDKAIYTKSAEISRDLTFEVGKVKAFGVDMEDAGVEYLDDLSGDYLIVAKRSSGNFFYMTPDLGTASTKRFQAVDTGATTTDAIEMNESYKWTVEESGNAYVIGANGQYITWSSGNSANLATTGKAMTIEKASNADYYTIALVDDATRKLGLNNTAGNNYFAFYAGTQIHNLYLIPFVEDLRDPQDMSFSYPSITYTLGSEEFEEPNLVGAQTTVTYTSSNEAIATVDASTGAVTFEGETGTVTITATAAETDKYRKGTASYTINVESDEIEALTIADFLKKEKGTTYYQLTGEITNLYDTQYGNFYLVDETGTVTVYGLTKEKIAYNDKSFESIGVKEGDIVTLIGTRDAYNNTPQVGGPAYYVSHISLTSRELAFSSTSVVLTLGETFTAPKLSGYTEGVTYASSNTAVATVDASTGAVEIVGAGTTTITASAPRSGNYSAGSASYTISIQEPGSSEVTDVIDYKFTDITGTSYKDWSNTGASGATYKGQGAGDSNTVQLRSKNSNSGIVTTKSAGKVTKIVIKWNTTKTTNTSRTVNIYGQDTAYSAATDLYKSSAKKIASAALSGATKGVSTIVLDGTYEHIGLRSNDGALYLDSIEITWSTDDAN